jgi:RNA polymerase sigma factor (sigma-70 family)
MPIFRHDPALLPRFRRGEPDAIELVYRAYVRKVTEIIRFGGWNRRNGSTVSGLATHAEEILDLTQEVFARAFSERARAQYDESRDYGPYLFAITRNVMLDWWRRRGREVAVDPLGPDEQHFQPLPHDGAPWEEPRTMAIVERYLAALPAELRTLHQLRFVAGRAQADVARAMGISRQTVRTLEARLRDGLRLELETEEVTAAPLVRAGQRV